MPENAIMSEQHKVFHHLQQVLHTDRSLRAAAQSQREAAEAQAEQERQATQVRLDAELDRVASTMQRIEHTISNSEWDNKVEPGTSQLSLMSGNPPATVMSQCQGQITSAHSEIARFIEQHKAPSNISTPIGCLTFFIGAVVWFLVSAVSGGNGGIIVLGLLLGIAAWIVCAVTITQASKAPLRNAYATAHAAMTAAQKAHQQQLAEAGQRHQNQFVQARMKYEQRIDELNKQLPNQLLQLKPEFLHLRNSESDLGNDWTQISEAQWKPATTTVQATRIGEFRSPHPILPSVPAMIGCPGYENLLFEVAGDAKQPTLQAIQSIMLHMLATQPPGKVRFTLLDPIGLGQNVAPFMQLVDDDEKLVGNRAWSETKHIEQQLADLSEHMGNVIQKYLRGQYATIEDYNKDVGEVEEPYRILVVTGFPVKFSPEAATRLVEIATNGTRCGVFTIVMLDTEQPDPYDFNRADLERASSIVTWNGHCFAWQHPDFADIQLQLDVPPPLSLFNSILKKVGERSSESSEVRVKFGPTALPLEEWWQRSTGDGIRVPLGRVGRKIQYMSLGQKEHHALLAGKTGSGKTNLLHVLLLNLALTYSPDELELYLIDFKTVGFTPYARFKLPHARVVATQSEREFGLSVLQKLDALLEERKKLFSNASKQDEQGIRDVQNIVKFRENNPGVRMPRVLLLVDEFQEFFTYDDKVAQEATLLLDRLVRQGRAFGIHVLLGSQTLAGGYTPARATIGQMGIRIALQCEEADSRLILSDDNPAARLLSRPGEAIYNDHNGLVDSNTKFQSFWLSEDELSSYLGRIHTYMQRSSITLPWEQTVFFGDADANIEKNTALDKALITPYSQDTMRTVTTWIGDPIAIKESVTIQFHSDTGNNVLMVGQKDEAALGMHISTMISLAAHYSPQQAHFYIFDFTPSDHPLAGRLESLQQTLPHRTKMVTRRTLPAAIDEIHSELTRRMDENPTGTEAIYLFIYGLQRIKDLRPDESMGFSSFGEPSTSPSIPKQFAAILRDGPEVGIHTIAWCDTYSNVTRSLERNSLRDFELRIAFQMSPEDSTNLLDVPDASKLGSHRAFLYSEETGRLEKFIPYGTPSSEWLKQAVAKLQQKVTIPVNY